jgi:hypothetical protein
MIHCAKVSTGRTSVGNYGYIQEILFLEIIDGEYTVVKVETKRNTLICPVGEETASFVGGLRDGGVFAAANGFD